MPLSTPQIIAKAQRTLSQRHPTLVQRGANSLCIASAHGLYVLKAQTLHLNPPTTVFTLSREVEDTPTALLARFDGQENTQRALDTFEAYALGGNHLYLAVDLETLSVTPDAVITSIGVQAFSYAKGRGQLLSTFEVHIDIDSGLRAGGKVRGKTVEFWLSQSQEARSAFIEGQRTALAEKEALRRLSAWVRDQQIGFEQVIAFGNGSVFDLAGLNMAYARHGQTPPWPFWNALCGRTLLRHLPHVPAPEREGVHHTAAGDATHLARTLIHAAQEAGAVHLIQPDPTPTENPT